MKNYIRSLLLITMIGAFGLQDVYAAKTPKAWVQEEKEKMRGSFKTVRKAVNNFVEEAKNLVQTAVVVGLLPVTGWALGRQYELAELAGARALLTHEHSWPVFCWHVGCGAARFAKKGAQNLGCAAYDRIVKPGVQSLTTNHRNACLVVGTVGVALGALYLVNRARRAVAPLAGSPVAAQAVAWANPAAEVPADAAAAVNSVQ